MKAHLQDWIVEVGNELDAWNIQLQKLLVAGEKQVDAGGGSAGQMD
jgi:hypothetical protein